jgi:hypothetical protein
VTDTNDIGMRAEPLPAERTWAAQARHRSTYTGIFAQLNARLLAAIVIAVMLVVMSLPAVFGYLSSPADRRFMGIVLNVPDTAQYLAWAHESRDAVLIPNTLTSEPGEPVFLNLFWLMAGRLSSAFGLELSEILQVLRPVVGAAYLAAIFWFIGLVTPGGAQRWITFFVVALGAGLGWVFVIAKQFTGELAFPLDLNIMEPNTFLTIMAFPHQAMAGALIVTILGLSLRAFELDSLGAAAVAGALGLALGLQHGYDLLIVYAVVGALTLVLCFRGPSRLRPVVLCGVICAPSGAAALYLLALTARSPVWRGVLAQYGNAGVQTPHPGHLLILMGLPLILVLIAALVIGAQAIRGERRVALPGNVRELLLLTWLIVGFALLYVPTSFQVKMLAAWQVPVGIYATRIVFKYAASVLPRLVRVRPEVLVGIGLVAAVLPANVYHYAWRFVDLARHDYPYYLERDDVAALQWLEANAQPSDVVLSSLTVGQYVPSISGSRPFLAHWAATLDFFEKRRLVARFFDPQVSDDERREIVARFGVTHVFHGKPERALGTYEPEQSAYFDRVFSSPHAAVYQVRQAAQMAR